VVDSCSKLVLNHSPSLPRSSSEVTVAEFDARSRYGLYDLMAGGSDTGAEDDILLKRRPVEICRDSGSGEPSDEPPPASMKLSV
jgi:hypothetical protein